ncbi:glycosyltransferase family 4 protein [Proteobacteria bacterium 005FR1]|nr:glycosyltransferase family 4 protein [Proteobacteria bacterium 005FR1]
MTGILVFFHCESNPGYAAASHEHTFLNMALRLVGNYQDVHFAYPTLKDGMSPTLPKELTNVIEFDAESRSHRHLSEVAEYIRKHDIKLAFGFDQPVRRLSHKYMRKAGVRHIVSYIGAPSSSINSGLKLALKKVDVALARSKPDHFIYQSEDMRRTGTHGRGIPIEDTSIVRTGIDMERFSPPAGKDHYAHDVFGIDHNAKIVFFSGHMENRKGVDVIVKSAVHLVEEQKRSDVHFLILGNKDGQEKAFLPLYEGTGAEKHITFGGYRSDVPQILKSCSVGLIASTGWDSFPMSSIEMAATGLPLVVSDLPGLREAVRPETGFHYPVGDHLAAATCLTRLLDDDLLRERMGRAGRQRAMRDFSRERQIKEMETIVRRVAWDVLPESNSTLRPAASS